MQTVRIGIVGHIDEVRISDVARYSDTLATPRVEFSADSHALLPMHMNEGSGAFADNVALLGGDGALDANSAWSDGAPIAPQQPGDLNCDGRVDFNDISAFVKCLVLGACP